MKSFIILTPHPGNMVKMCKSRRVRCVEAGMRKMRNAYKILGRQPQGKRPNVNGMIILKWILKKQDVKMWIGF
jgi:hypothetical protein